MTTRIVHVINPSNIDAYINILRGEKHMKRIYAVLRDPEGNKLPRLNNHEMGQYVRARKPFKNNHGSVYAVEYPENASRTSRCYVVYSYGMHFPMYVWDYTTQKWYGNKDKYSSTTSRHQSACNPHTVDLWFDTDAMKELASRGFMGMMEYLASKPAEPTVTWIEQPKWCVY